MVARGFILSAGIILSVTGALALVFTIGDASQWFETIPLDGGDIPLGGFRVQTLILSIGSILAGVLLIIESIKNK